MQQNKNCIDNIKGDRTAKPVFFFCPAPSFFIYICTLMQTDEILNKGLEKTKKGLFSRLSRAVLGRSKVDDQVLDDLEEALIASDVGVDNTQDNRQDRGTCSAMINM